MHRLWALLPLALGLGCLNEPDYTCSSNDVCILEGFQGTCDLVSATCVYPSSDCAGLQSSEGWVNGKGNCVPEPANAVSPTTTSSGTNGPTTDMPTSGAGTTDPTMGVMSDSTTGMGSEGESAEPGESSGGEESTEGGMTMGDGCGMGMGANITDQGTVSASSTFQPHEAALSVDGELDTSWFSAGPEGGGGPSVYGWNTVTNRCIQRIEIDDNSMHQQEEFRTGYGFANVVVRVLESDSVIFEESISLPGTPDGPVSVDTGGILGSRVLLELGGHEDEDCGGFSELRVYGGPA